MKTEFPEVCPEDISTEVETLHKDHSKIRKNVRKYVLIQGNSVVDYFASYRDALSAGYKLFGLKDFLVRLVKEQDVPIRVMRFGVVQMGNDLHLAKPKKG